MTMPIATETSIYFRFDNAEKSPATAKAIMPNPVYHVSCSNHTLNAGGLPSKLAPWATVASWPYNVMITKMPKPTPANPAIIPAIAKIRVFPWPKGLPSKRFISAWRAGSGVRPTF